MDSNVESVRQALYAASQKGARKAIREQAMELQRITHSCATYPDACLDLIVEILAVNELFSKSGIDIFVLDMITTMYRLSDSQKQRLLQAISDHYSEYADEEMCTLLGDLVARNYDQSTAMQTFKALFNSATDQGKEGIALGLDILARDSKRDPRVMKEIQAILGHNS